MTQEIPSFAGGNAKNLYQPLIDIIDILLIKIEITPKDKLWTGNPVQIHISETSLPQNASGVEGLTNILNTLKQGGSVRDINTNHREMLLTRDIFQGGAPRCDVLFTIFEPNKELLIKEREKWLVKGAGDRGQTAQKNKFPHRLPAEITNIAKPYTEVKSGVGSFKFYKEGKLISIGKPATRHFRLLQTLCDPRFGVHKTIDSVFEAIRIPKDKLDTILNNSGTETQRMRDIIGFTIKELQKNKDLQGKVKYKFGERKEDIWLESEG